MGRAACSLGVRRPGAKGGPLHIVNHSSYLLTTTTIRHKAATIPGYMVVPFWKRERGLPCFALLILAWVGNARSYVGLYWCGDNHRL